MKTQLTTYLFLLLFSIPVWSITIDQSTATALNPVNLYADSTFTEDTEYVYKEGDMFRVLRESAYEHPDADQKQKFKWYQVETPDNRVGWIFGDGLAVYVSQQDLDPVLLPYHRRKVTLGNGFDSAITWVASIQGRDNFHQEDYMNPLYSEFYLVVTNFRGRSVMMKCAGESARGETSIKNVETKDITGDGHPEFIVQRGTKNVGSHIIERDLEIYSLKAGTLVSIFKENMGLAYETGIPSPALYKYVEIEDRTIRISYLDYVVCDNYKQSHPTDAKYPRQERCMEYVTSYYNWDKRSKAFKNLYGNSRTSPKGGSWESGIALKNVPKNNGNTISRINRGDVLTLIKHYEEYVVENGKKKIRNWFYVSDSKGKLGYVDASQIGFMELEHADVLNRYYLNPPLSKSDWKLDAGLFLKVLLP